MAPRPHSEKSSDPLDPQAVPRREFRSTFRGYDQLEVKAYLTTVAVELQAVLEREQAQAARADLVERKLAELSDIDEDMLLDALGERADQVLSGARQEASDIEADAIRRAQAIRGEAEADAERIRSEARKELRQQLEEGARAQSRQRADIERLTQQSKARTNEELEEARREGRIMVDEARRVRDRMIKDLAVRRRIAQRQYEALTDLRTEILSRLDAVSAEVDRGRLRLDDLFDGDAELQAQLARVESDGPKEVDEPRPSVADPGGPDDAGDAKVMTLPTRGSHGGEESAQIASLESVDSTGAGPQGSGAGESIWQTGEVEVVAIDESSDASSKLASPPEGTTPSAVVADEDGDDEDGDLDKDQAESGQAEPGETDAAQVNDGALANGEQESGAESGDAPESDGLESDALEPDALESEVLGVDPVADDANDPRHSESEDAEVFSLDDARATSRRTEALSREGLSQDHPAMGRSAASTDDQGRGEASVPSPVTELDLPDRSDDPDVSEPDVPEADGDAAVEAVAATEASTETEAAADIEAGTETEASTETEIDTDAVAAADSSDQVDDDAGGTEADTEDTSPEEASPEALPEVIDADGGESAEIDLDAPVEPDDRTEDSEVLELPTGEAAAEPDASPAGEPGGNVPGADSRPGSSTGGGVLLASAATLVDTTELSRKSAPAEVGQTDPAAELAAEPADTGEVDVVAPTEEAPPEDDEPRDRPAKPLGDDVEALFARIRAGSKPDANEPVITSSDDPDTNDTDTDPKDAGPESLAPPIPSAPKPSRSKPTGASSTSANLTGSSDAELPQEDEDSDSVSDVDWSDYLQLRADAVQGLDRKLGRRLKRLLSDDQNDVLDRLRRHGSSAAADEILPDVEEHQGRYRAEPMVELGRAANSGAALMGSSGASSELLGEFSRRLAAELSGPLHHRLIEVIAEADGADDEAVAKVRNCYREVKLHQVREMASTSIAQAFAAGLYEAIDSGTPVRWVRVDPDSCGVECEQNAESPPLSKGASFPSGDHSAPRASGCRCGVIPAEG